MHIFFKAFSHQYPSYLVLKGTYYVFLNKLGYVYGYANMR